MLKKEEKIERLKWMLNAVESGKLETGLCRLYDDEYGRRLGQDFPDLALGGGFLFYPGEKEPRIKFLREWIDKLSGEKSLVQQLVDNVNQNGGEIFGLRVGDKLPEDTINAWQSSGKNYYDDENGVYSTVVPFHNNREILRFFVVGGDIFFHPDGGTDDIGLRAEGYKKFAEEFETPKQTYSIGQRFLYKGKEEYILAHVSKNMVCLVNLEEGNHWSELVFTESPRKITEKELQKIKDGGDFTLINKK